MTARQDKRNGQRNGHWYFRRMVRLPDGRRERIYGVAARHGQPDTKAGALEAERLELQRVLSTGEVKPTPAAQPRNKEVPTLKEFAATFLETSRAGNKPSTIETKEQVLRQHILPRLGMLRLDEISYEHIEDLRIQLSTFERKPGKKRSPKTVNNIMTTLHRLLVVAKKRSLISSLPEFEPIRCPMPEFDFLSFEEAPRLIAAARDEWRTLITFALRTGLRRGELMGLRWQDVDLVAGKVLVRQTIWRGIVGPPKNHKGREVPLSAPVVAMLKQHRHLRGPLVFCNTDGSYLNGKQFKLALEATCKRAGLRFIGWHCLRHTFASHLAMLNAPLKAIQELLGHASIQMTMRYAHLSPSVAIAAVEMLDKADVAAGWQRPSEEPLTA